MLRAPLTSRLQTKPQPLSLAAEYFLSFQMFVDAAAAAARLAGVHFVADEHVCVCACLCVCVSVCLCVCECGKGYERMGMTPEKKENAGNKETRERKRLRECE
jgi:hypothetical protein